MEQKIAPKPEVSIYSGHRDCKLLRNWTACRTFKQLRDCNPPLRKDKCLTT